MKKCKETETGSESEPEVAETTGGSSQPPALPIVLTNPIPDDVTFSGKELKQCLGELKIFMIGDPSSKK